MLVQDATRFLLRYYQTIATWPLQIYSSAIIFSPQTSAVRKNNLDKIPRWLRKLPQVEEAWASLIQTLAGHSDWVWAVAFSPDSKQIASGSGDKTIKLWDATTGDLQKTLAGHSGSVRAVAFLPDGKRIASGSGDETIKLWDATTGDLQKTLAGHSDSVWAVAFSPDGKRIASGSGDNTIKLWDVPKSLKASRLLGSTIGSSLKFRAWKEIKTSGIVDSLKFSKDGRRLVTNLGPIKIESVLADRHSPDYELLEDLSVGNQWIYYGAMPVFRLTSDFEPQCYDGRGNQAAIGFRNGRVLSFEIDRRSLHLALKESAYMYSNESVGR
jgi:WD40 repeat protein